MLLQDGTSCSLGTKFFGAQQFGASAILFFAADGPVWINVAGIDTHDVPPTAHPLSLVNVLRPDEPRPSLDRDEVLAMAPAAEDHRFRVPRILDAP